jgi:hypothetical protein
VTPRRFPYGAAERPTEARRPGGLLRSLGVLEYEIRSLPEWDVLARGSATGPSSEFEHDAEPASD